MLRRGGEGELYVDNLGSQIVEEDPKETPPEELKIKLYQGGEIVLTRTTGDAQENAEQDADTLQQIEDALPPGVALPPGFALPQGFAMPPWAKGVQMGKGPA